MLRPAPAPESRKPLLQRPTETAFTQDIGKVHRFKHCHATALLALHANVSPMACTILDRPYPNRPHALILNEARTRS
jgi:hypothetical protein